MEEAQEEVLGPDAAIAPQSGFFQCAGDGRAGAGFVNFSNTVVSLPVFGVCGLPGHAEGVPDLFPGPSLLPGARHRRRLDLLGQPVQRTHRP